MECDLLSEEARGYTMGDGSDSRPEEKSGGRDWRFSGGRGCLGYLHTTRLSPESRQPESQGPRADEFRDLHVRSPGEIPLDVDDCMIWAVRGREGDGGAGGGIRPAGGHAVLPVRCRGMRDERSIGGKGKVSSAGEALWRRHWRKKGLLSRGCKSVSRDEAVLAVMSDVG